MNKKDDDPIKTIMDIWELDRLIRNLLANGHRADSIKAAFADMVTKQT